VAADDDELLPAASPSRNQLLIAVVELGSGEGTRRLYEEELDTVGVVFRSQLGKESVEMELSRKMPVREVRELLYAELNN
jgi:hypothetical protein